LHTSSQEVPQSATAVAIGLIGPISGPIPKFAIGGAFLGESVGQIKDLCKRRGYGLEKGHGQIMWDNLFGVIWTARSICYCFATRSCSKMGTQG
jgi:hypothetical protein